MKGAQWLKKGEKQLWLPLLSMLLISSSACTKTEKKSEICVSAAVSLKDALVEASRQFETRNPECKVTFNFGASGQLCRQIEEGAPVDLFISASTQQVEDLKQKGRIVPGEVRRIAGNSLVLLSSKDRSFAGLAELKDAERIAIGDPKIVPAGVYAVQALKKAGIYENLAASHKLVLAGDARQVLTYVESGDVDAGLVYFTDALQRRKARLCFVVPRDFSSPVQYEAVVLQSAPRRQLAQSFFEYLSGAEAKKIFLGRGFTE